MNDLPAEPAAPSSGEETASSHLPAPVPSPAASRASLLAPVEQVLAALRFYSRFADPCSDVRNEPACAARFRAGGMTVAVAGALLGAIGGLVLFGAAAVLPPVMAALLAVGAMAPVTGALHEDGLADSADGLGGGRTREQCLEIMRDSRIGSYGAVAIVLALGLRVAALAALVDQLGGLGAALALVAVSATSRVAGLVPLWLLPAARADGAAAAASRPTGAAMALGSVVALAIAIATLWVPGVLVVATALSVVTAFAAAYAATRVADAKIGGQTGDIAGAAQQLAEIAMLLILVAAAMPALLA